MMVPATASTGITALTPMSGASAAGRMMPVPKPPMPPTTAAMIPRMATKLKVEKSSSKSARHGPRLAGAVDRDVGERRLGHLYHLRIGRPALGVHLDRHRDRGVADANQVDVEREQVADLHRLLESEFL